METNVTGMTTGINMTSHNEDLLEKSSGMSGTIVFKHVIYGKPRVCILLERVSD